MDAIQLLTDQHRLLEERFAAAVDAADPRERDALAAEALDQLAVHVTAEEDVFYPAVKARRTEDIRLESLEEHLALKRLLADLIDLPADDVTYQAKLKVLREQAEHHHSEEEEHLFPRVRRCLDPAQLEALGREMLACQKRLIREGQPREMLAEQTAKAMAL
ncbi:MAG TPA: hemerythrin domain-containing protein [Burkholderiaceae bacterium]|nr:hemerythrin domain-containing protein [Burkholderiaceae bacterium]